MALIVCVGSRSGFFVSYSLSFVWRQVFSFSLDLVKLTDVFQCLSRQLTLVCLVPVVELATGMILMRSRFLSGVGSENSSSHATFGQL